MLQTENTYQLYKHKIANMIMYTACCMHTECAIRSF